MKRFLLVALVGIGVAAATLLAGCGGSVGENRFWWDDKEKKTLENYELPPAPNPGTPVGSEEK